MVRRPNRKADPPGRAPPELEQAIHTYIETTNAQPKPFVWTKTADEILASVARFCKRISDSGHLDNLSEHKTQAVREFLQQHPRVRFHFTPTYSSWLNQVELWFAKIEREVIARGIFTSVSDLARKLRRYINAYSANARPIQWKYSDPTRRVRSNELTATGH